MIRVLYVEASSGGVLGGSLSGLYHLIRGIDREHFSPLMVLYEPKPIEKDLAELGVPVYHVRRRRLPKDHMLLRYEGYHQARRLSAIRSGMHNGREAARLLIEEMPAAAALVRVISRARPDVLHLGNGLRANFDGVLAGMLTRTPAVVHVKGFEKYERRERWASRHVQAMVCMTQAILDYCESRGVRSRLARVVYDAVDDAWLQPRRPIPVVREEIGVPAEAPCVVIAGNVQEWKGQRVLVDAMAQVVQAHPRAHCLIAGGVHRAGEDYARALRQRAAELGLNGSVHFLGFREDVADVMNAADVVVHASIRPEPFGRVILEGMLLGKPVIATAAGGVLELIEDKRTGFLVPPGDVAALSACLRRVLSDPVRARAVGAEAQRLARERFSLARHVEEMSRIYEAAVARRV
jgi:glycosyltransferase involved in cell wall biosynthesis